MGLNLGNTNVSTTLEDQQPSSRSFFSRFALSKRSRTRNLADFYIRPAEPHRKYTAGENVTGAVHLTVVKPVRITHLTVALRGFVRVYKNPNAAHEPINPTEIATDGASHFRYLGNGYASLFKDEVVLSADGRLDAGKYEFNFELVFPETGLPSSIDFERGTIAYMITATLTRPTSISPTTSCDRKVELIEQVDVGPLAPPRPHTISLEPISKKARRKKPSATTAALSDKNGSAAATDPTADAGAFDIDPTRVIETSTDGSVAAEDSGHDAHNNPRSPIHSDLRSEVSGDSTVSGSTGLSSGRGSEQNQAGSLGTIQGGKSAASDGGTITATIELLKGGCLPGDTISVKVSVQHIKRIRSMHGVIVTLYRQSRVDSAPPASLFKNLSKEEARKLEKEEYYPKSKTGLGGLSLTSAGSCSVFRKDLSQAFSPLIIDPATLSATVTTHVRVPEHAFPTIKGVPGEMISFKYRLEVIVDLGGKLSNAIQVSQTPTAGGVIPGRNQFESVGAGVATFDGSLINTDTLKREKGVIFDSFEVIVGTADSSRRGKAVVRPSPSVHSSYMPEGAMFDENTPWNGWEDEGYGQEDAYQQNYAPFSAEPSAPYPYWNGGVPHEPMAAPTYIPPPNLPDESSLSEKERIRRAEQRLLPSQPGAPSSPANVPGLSNTNNLSTNDPDGVDSSIIPRVPSAPPPPPPVANSSEFHHHEATGDEPSAPTLEDVTSTSANPVDDKQELERQRLLAEASAPPEFPEDYDAGGPSSSAGPEPSAPVFSEEDEYGHHYAHNGGSGATSSSATAFFTPSTPSEPLPRYER